MSRLGEGFLARPDGERLAYCRSAGRAPGVMFLHGFRSDMTGDKALAVESFCRDRGLACLRFDGFGHGRSSGEFARGTVSRWAEDAVALLDALTEGPQILVGSSMGGWLMLLAARSRPARVAALLGIAAAPDFTEDLIRPSLSAEAKRALDEQGQFTAPGTYGLPPCPITRDLLDDGRRNLVLGSTIPVFCPVRLLHGLEDPDVPWRTAMRLQQSLASTDVSVTLVKGGGHRLSEPADIARMLRVLEELVDKAGGAFA